MTEHEIFAKEDSTFTLAQLSLEVAKMCDEKMEASKQLRETQLQLERRENEIEDLKNAVNLDQYVVALPNTRDQVAVLKQGEDGIIYLTFINKSRLLILPKQKQEPYKINMVTLLKQFPWAVQFAENAKTFFVAGE